MSSRLLYLDVLRGVAILLVIGNHLAITPPASDYAWARIPFDCWQHVGWMGVPLFFGLSGFLIGGLLFQDYAVHGAIRMSRFYVRRLFKIWPPYLTWLATTSAFLLWEARRTPEPWALTLQVLGANLLHLQNYLPGAPYPLWLMMAGHTWSLSIEEHFYLLLPFLLLAAAALGQKAGDTRLRAGPPLLLAVIGAALVGRCYVAMTSTETPGSEQDATAFVALYATHLRIDALALGVLLAYLVHFRPGVIEVVRPHRHWLLPLSVAFAVPSALPAIPAYQDYSGRLHYTLGLTLLSVGSVAAVLWAWLASGGGDPQARGAPPPRPWTRAIIGFVAMVGVSSYSIYLWHIPFGHIVSALLATRLNASPTIGTYLLSVLVYAGFCLGFGMVMYRLIEVPALHLRHRWGPAGPDRRRTSQESRQITAPPTESYQVLPGP